MIVAVVHRADGVVSQTWNVAVWAPAVVTWVSHEVPDRVGLPWAGSYRSWLPLTVTLPEAGCWVTVTPGVMVPPPVIRVAALKLWTWKGMAVPVPEALRAGAKVTVKLPEVPPVTA